MSNLGKESIGKLLINLATPAIIAQIVNVLYNIVDRIFIGRIENGDIAMAGVGVSFPIILLISACSALWGTGGAPLCAIKMGAGDNDAAEKILTNSFVMLCLTAITLTSSFFIFGQDLLWFFGASEATIGYAWSYLSIYLIGTIFTQISLGLNPFINTQGQAKMGMATVMIGAGVNIMLDPIFIFGFDMGVKGAALATVIAQASSAIWVLFFFKSTKSKLRIRRKYLRPNRRIVGSTLALGISPFVMQSTESLVLISLNTQLARFGGDIAVSAMTIMTSIMQMIMMPIRGLGEGLQPIVSFNYGAKQLDRVRATIKLALKVGMSYNIVFVAALLLFPSLFVYIFNDNPLLVEATSKYIRIYFVGMTIFGAQVVCQQIFLSLGQAKVSIFIAILRKIILLVPLIYILPKLMDNKVNAVLTAEPISDILSALTAVTLFTIFYRKNLRKMV